MNFIDLPYDILYTLNTFLDHKSTCCLKVCNKIFSDFPIKFNENVIYNPHYKDSYPLLIKNLKECVYNILPVNGMCINCGIHKEVGLNGITVVGEDIPDSEKLKFTNLKLENMILPNIDVCPFTNLKTLELNNVSADYFHFPENLEKLIINNSEFVDITMNEKLIYLEIFSSNIDEVYINDNLKSISVTKSVVEMEGDPSNLETVHLFDVNFQDQQIFNQVNIKEIILINVKNLTMEDVYAENALIINTETTGLGYGKSFEVSEMI